MSRAAAISKISHILCPTDLSERSQRVLACANEIATVLGAKLTAFHSARDSWLNDGLVAVEMEEIVELHNQIKNVIVGRKNADFDVIIERNSDPATAIPRLVRELRADLIVMKARPGMLSALHFGSIVERVVANAACPVLLMPSRFLANHISDEMPIRRVLFDYDFSQATDDLFHIANALTRDYSAKLHVLSVLEPPRGHVEVAAVSRSQSLLESVVQNRLSAAVRAEGISPSNVPTSVEWGRHSDRILEYAHQHDIDLICTALPAPTFYFDKFYKTYLGQLLGSANCPVLVKQCV